MASMILGKIVSPGRRSAFHPAARGHRGGQAGSKPDVEPGVWEGVGPECGGVAVFREVEGRVLGGVLCWGWVLVCELAAAEAWKSRALPLRIAGILLT